MHQHNINPVKPSFLDWTFRVLGFVVLALIAFSIPAMPAIDLDASWRIALGKFFTEGRQFGTEVVFTYGPLGFIMGNTYWGGQWAILLAWQAVLGVVFAALVFSYGFRLSGYNRLFFFIFFFIFGLSYQDAMQQIIIAFAGLDLIRRSDQAWRWSSLGLIGLLAVLSLVKFTNIVLCVVLVGLAGGLAYWQQRRLVSALRVPLLYLGSFLVGWILCGQKLGNLWAYFNSSWEISQGYQDTMGISCPAPQLYLGLFVLGLIVAHALLNLFSHTDRIRATVMTAAVGAFIYLNWKHGFIRADGHQIGFYYAVLTVVVTSALLLEDGPRLRGPKRALLILAGLLSLWGMEAVLPGLTRGALGGAQGEVDTNVSFLLHPTDSRHRYDAKLEGEKAAVDMLKTKSIVGSASVDVLGFEQSVAIFNDFNYQPRPVFQGYSAYTPYLSRLNYDYYASDKAPDYVLFKLQTLDGRLATMDDPHVLRLLIQRYTYKFSDQGYTIWQRKPGAFNAETFEPKLIRTFTAQLGKTIDLSDLTQQHIWAEIDYEFSWLGKLRRFFFKPPLVQLRIIDEAGVESVHRLPQPIGRAGFMLNPVINDLLDFMRAAGGSPKRQVKAIVIETAPQDLDCFKNEIKVSLSSMPASAAGIDYFKAADQALFNMFVDAPSSYTALNPPNEDIIDNRKVIIMHAPSEMVFDVPSGAGEINGYFGFVPGAYSNGGKTNGAEFTIVWRDDNSEPIVLLDRYLEPVHKLNDRGLTKFNVKLPQSRGRLYLRVSPGPYGEFAFDWTGWSGIEFK